jgi:hypothetical protein
MTKYILRGFITAGLLAVSAVSGFSQSTFALRVHVPFAFMAGQANLPAGDYLVAQDATSGIITLQNAASMSAASVLTSIGDAPLEGRSPQLVFERHGERTVLKQIRLADTPARLLPAAFASMPVR